MQEDPCTECEQVGKGECSARRTADGTLPPERAKSRAQRGTFSKPLPRSLSKDSLTFTGRMVTCWQVPASPLLRLSAAFGDNITRSEDRVGGS